MRRKIKINHWVAGRTHCFNNKYPVSLLFDVKKDIYYFLKGTGSVLLNLIFHNSDYVELESFASKNNMLNELNSLLFELKEKEIIDTAGVFEKSNYRYLVNAISSKSSNYKYFYSNWMRYVYSHGNINMLALELNYKCNLKCRHCYNRKDMNEDYISFNQAKKAIDEAYEMGISFVKITGGECTLNKDFLKIAGYVRSKYLELQVNTNGQVLNQDEVMLKKLVEMYPSEISISLYSINPDVHDYITGVKGSCEKTINVIKKLKELNANVVISTPLLSYNKDCYREVFEFANSLGVKCGSGCIFINNPDNANLSAKPALKDIEQFYMNKFSKGENIKTNLFTKSDKPICEAGYDRLCITPELNVTPCVTMNYILGNLKVTSLSEIKSGSLAEFRKNFIRKNLTECFNEEYCKYCFYCSDTACFNNTFMKKQPILCENAKAYYNAVKNYRNKRQNCERIS